MSYLAVTLNHFRPIRSWARSAGAEATLNAVTFELELKVRNRYYLMHPRFLIRRGGSLTHGAELTADTTGFIGWLPYKPLRWEFSTDKLLFKALLQSKGIFTPETASESSIPSYDFVLKRSIGSFGKELAGPFRAGLAVSEVAGQLPASGNPDAKLYAERFIAGTNVKLWFWGATPFHAHRDEYATVVGDGSSSLCDLVVTRLRSVGYTSNSSAPLQGLPEGDRSAMRSTMDYQGVTWTDVPAAGQAIWMDYRYGRRYRSEASTNESDNALQTFSPSIREQIASIGALLSSALEPLFPVPVLYSVDAVLDASGRLWWLEMNSNPVLPPEGYPLILNSLFGTPVAGPNVALSVASAAAAPVPTAATHTQVVAA